MPNSHPWASDRFWGVVMIAVLKRWSRPDHPPAIYRGAGVVLIPAGAVGFALAERLVGEPFYSQLLSNLMLAFGSAVGGVYLARGLGGSERV